MLVNLKVDQSRMTRPPVHSFASSSIFALVFASLWTVVPSADAKWATYGSPASLADSNQVLPRSLSDGSGGTFLVWEDYRWGDADIYAHAGGMYEWEQFGFPVQPGTAPKAA